VAAAIADMLGEPVHGVQPLSGGDICRSYRVELRDGRTIFAKQAPAGAAGMLGTEAAGLAWLRDAGAPVPEVLAQSGDLLLLAWVAQQRPDAAAAEQFGADLARLHSSGAPAFGSPPPGAGPVGFIGSAAMSFASGRRWPDFFVEHRIRPYLLAARALQRVSTAQYDTIASLCDRIGKLAGPETAPARLHGDLWSGNLLWNGGRAVLIDPAAHGGHPESDLAMLALFSAPHFADVIAGYQRHVRLRDGWRERVPLHQLYPLLVHAQLFGGGYGASAAAAAASAMRRIGG
jgi:fructosamine-3-kinase